MTTRLLDRISATGLAPVAFRKLREAYTGYCVRLRRNADDVEADFGFDSDGWLDAAAVAAFKVGSVYLYVVRWYYQDASGGYREQADPGKQPKLEYDSDGYPRLKIESGKWLEGTVVPPTAGTPISVFSLAVMGGFCGDYGRLFSLYTDGSNDTEIYNLIPFCRNGPGSTSLLAYSNGTLATASITLDTPFLAGGRLHSGEFELWVDGVLADSSAFTVPGGFAPVLTAIGNEAGPAKPSGDAYEGFVYDVIPLVGTVSDADQREVEGDQGWGNGKQALLPSGHPYESAPPDDGGGDPDAITGTLTGTFAALTTTSAGQLALTGSLSATFSALTAASSGQLQLQGSTNRTFAALTTTAAGALSVQATFSATLAPLTSTAAGSLTLHGSLTGTLGALTSTAAGALTLRGSLGGTFAPLTLTAGGYGVQTGSGALNVTLQPLTASSAGVLRLQGALTSTLGALSTTSAGRLVLRGAAAITLQALAASGAARLALRASLAATLAPLTSAASARLQVTGALSRTLAALTVTSAGSAGSSGRLNCTLAPLSTAAAGVLALRAGVSATFAPLTTAAAAALHLTGALARTLQALTAHAFGQRYGGGTLTRTFAPLTLTAIGRRNVAAHVPAYRVARAGAQVRLAASTQNRLARARTERRVVTSSQSG